jgi:alpha-amylase
VIFKIQGDGKDWAESVDTEHRNYDYLMGADIDHRHPEASDDLCNWGVWIMKELGEGAAGFRFDAVKVRLRLPSFNLSRRVKD